VSLAVLHLFCWLCYSPVRLYAADYRLGIDMTETYLSQSRYLNPYENRFSYNESSNLLALGTNVQLKFNDRVSGYFRGYLYWLYPFDDESSDIREIDVYLSDASLSFSNRNWAVRLGVQPIEFGRGLIFSDDTIGISVHLKKGPLFADLIGARVMDNSPVLGGSIGYHLGLFQQVEAFALYYEDRENAFSRTMEQSFSVSDLSNEGYLSWYGISANFFLGKLYGSAVGAYQYGQMDFSQSLRKIDRKISAYVFDLSIETNVTDRLTLGIFCFGASGDKEPLHGDFTAFISPRPYNLRAAIFFDPNFMDIDQTSRLVFGGTAVQGVIAPGFQFTFEPVRDLLFEGKLASFYPQNSPSTHGSWYGWEGDVEIRYRLKSNTLLFLEFARFEHGDFFKFQSEEKPSEAIRLIIGGQVSFQASP
jgi:hypothetical protein